jgi:hypothetical protein
MLKKKRKKKKWKEAFDGYMNAVKLLLLILEKEVDEEKKQTIGQQASSVMDKAEKIKKQYLEPLSQNQASTITQKYTLHFRLEKVKAVKILSAQKNPELLIEDTLQLFSIENQYYINIGNNFAYELNQAIPCLAMSDGYYILPGTDNTFFGILFPENIPKIFCERWEQKISQLCILKVTQPSKIEDPDDNSQNLQITVQTQTIKIKEERVEKVVQMVDVGGHKVSQTILMGAEFISKKIESSAEKIKEVTEPSETPAQVPDSVKNTLRMAKLITPPIIELSGMLVKTVQKVAKGVGSLAADHINNKLSGKVDMEDPKITAAKNIGKAGVNAVVTIWNSLDEAGMILLSSTGKAVTNVVQHKYGNEAGKASQDGFVVVQDVAILNKNLRQLGLKGVVKGVAKETVKETLEIKPSENTVPQITDSKSSPQLLLPPSK